MNGVNRIWLAVAYSNTLAFFLALSLESAWSVMAIFHLVLGTLAVANLREKPKPIEITGLVTTTVIGNYEAAKYRKDV